MENIDEIFSLERIREEKEKIDKRKEEIVAMTLQLKQDISDLQSHCKHENLVFQRCGWDEPIYFCVDCGYEN